MEQNEKGLHPAMDELIAAATRVTFASTDFAANGDLMMTVLRMQKFLKPESGFIRLPQPLRKVVMSEYPDGWRGELLDGGETQVLDTTVDVYPSYQMMLSRIEETKTWLDPTTPAPDAQPPQ